MTVEAEEMKRIAERLENSRAFLKAVARFIGAEYDHARAISKHRARGGKASYDEEAPTSRDAVDLAHADLMIFPAITADLIAADLLALLAEVEKLKGASDALAWLGSRTGLELSHGYGDEAEDCEGLWLVHRVNGGVNDREWTLIGFGETPQDAIEAARAALGPSS
jgi:hypothetical protein